MFFLLIQFIIELYKYFFVKPEENRSNNSLYIYILMCGVQWCLQCMLKIKNSVKPFSKAACLTVSGWFCPRGHVTHVLMNTKSH